MAPTTEAAPPRTGLPSIDRVLPTLRLLAPQGFIIVSNYGLRGPEYFHSEYPKEWQREYERGSYFLGDPILRWAIFKTGGTRWSAVARTDEIGVLARARRFGLIYGAIFSRGGSIGPFALPGADKKTVLSLAREDREFTDEEMALLSEMVDRLVKELPRDRNLTIQEVETLRQFKDGLSYKEIAETLGIGLSTVKLRLSTARQKLGAASPAQALVIAVERNLL